MNVAIVDHDRAEVLEIEIDEGSTLAGRPIRESIADLPSGATIGAITRDGMLVTLVATWPSKPAITSSCSPRSTPSRP
jgi:Trk K+ transport system NAD-binding subunit